MPTFVILDSISLATPDGHRLFDGLTLALGRERTGVVGRNGCGKSTLLRLIADDSLTVAQALDVADDLACLRRLAQGEGSLDDAAEADWTLEARLQAALVETGLPAMPLDHPIA